MPRTDENRIPPTLLIGPSPPPVSGLSILFQVLCDGFQESGLPHSVVSIGDPDPQGRVDGSFHPGRIVKLCKPIFSAVGQLLLRRRGTMYLTIAQSWSGFLRDAVLIIAARIGSHRIVVHLHGGNYDRFYESQPTSRKWLIRRVLSSSDRILVLSECFVDHFAFITGHRDKTKVVFNGLPVQSTERTPAPKQLPADPSQPIRLLFMSNLIESKGYLEVLEAVRILRSSGVNAECHFCGMFSMSQDTTLYSTTAEAEADFKERVAEYGLGPYVKWKGVVGGAEKDREFEEAHFFVLPTSFCNEGQPVSIIEALAAGCPIISTRYRSIPEMLEFGRSGVLIDERDANQVVRAVEGLLAEPKSFQDLSSHARRRFEQAFTREAHLQAILPEVLGPGQQVLARRMWRLTHQPPVAEETPKLRRKAG